MRVPWTSTERRVRHKPLFQGIFLGRERLLEALDGHLQAVKAGSAQYVALTGAAGTGKSALLAEFALMRCTAPHVLLVRVNCGDCWLPQEFYVRVFEALRTRSNTILQALFNETKRLRKALAVNWDETEFCNILTSTDWAPPREGDAPSTSGRRTDPLGQLFALAAQHPWAIGAAVIIDCLTREAGRGIGQRQWSHLWKVLLHTLQSRRLPGGTALVLCLDQVDAGPASRGVMEARWAEHWQEFAELTRGVNLPLGIFWAGTPEGLAPVRQVFQDTSGWQAYDVPPLADEEWVRLLPRFLRGLPRAARPAWERLANTTPACRLPAHLVLTTTMAAALHAEKQYDAAALQTLAHTELAVVVQRLLERVRQQPVTETAFSRHVMEILAFLPPGKSFVLDDVFPLCDLSVLGLDVVRARAMLERLLGEWVRYGLLGFETYEARYTTEHSSIQQALQALICPTPEARQALARHRQLAVAVLRYVQGGEHEFLRALARRLADEEGAMASERLAPYLLTPLRRIVGQSSKVERQRIAEALGHFPLALTVDILTALLGDEEGQVRSRTAQSLADLEGIDTLPALLQALQDSNGDVRWIAACALGKMDRPATVDSLIALLTDEDKEVGRIAAEGLGHKNDRRAVPHLIAAMRDSYPLLRESAALALGQLGDKRALPALQELLQDTNPQVRRSAEAALGRLSPSVL